MTLRAIKELINAPGVLINISRIEWFDNYRVTNIMNSLFPFISRPSKKLFFNHLIIWHWRVSVGKTFLLDYTMKQNSEVKTPFT